MLKNEDGFFDLITDNLTKIFNKINDAIIIIDRHGKVVYVNEGYARIVGVDSKRVKGRDLNVNYPNDKLLKVLRTGIPIVDEEHYNDTLCSKIVASYIPLTDSSEQVIGVIGVGAPYSVYLLSKSLGSFLSTKNQIDLASSRQELPQCFDKIVGDDPRFLHCLKLAVKAAEADCTIMLRGETGVGKELFAEAIHKAGNRAKFPFVAVNCAAIPETLLESELFGYAPGAFTGARPSGRIGKFIEARGGTLFLDEIGELPLNMQAKLLRFIQERYVERVGGNEKIPIDVRIIAATNQNLELMAQQGDFRPDLYYRLQVVPLFIPSLRERQEDIPLLVTHFLDHYTKKYDKKLNISAETMEFLQQYRWPGNIRELSNVIEHMVVMCQRPTISLDYIPIQLKGEIKKAEFDCLNLNYVTESLEKEIIKKALQRVNDNKSKAIELLGISRSAFYAKLEKYGLKI